MATKTVLVVDDDAAQVAMLRTALQRNGYTVVTASNPVEGLAHLEGGVHVDLVLTDLMMPHVDGIRFTEQVHALPGLAELPVILLTAYGSDEVHEEGLRKGVALTLSKPVELSKLMDLVGFATH